MQSFPSTMKRRWRSIAAGQKPGGRLCSGPPPEVTERHSSSRRWLGSSRTSRRSSSSTVRVAWRASSSRSRPSPSQAGQQRPETALSRDGDRPPAGSGHSRRHRAWYAEGVPRVCQWCRAALAMPSFRRNCRSRRSVAVRSAFHGRRNYLATADQYPKLANTGLIVFVLLFLAPAGRASRS